MSRVLWMFSGQGSQFYGMGRELYEHEPVFREYMDRGDTVVRDLIHESIVDVLFRPRADRFEPFSRLLHSHPAILLVECALAEVLKRRGLRPDAMLGYSLGELASWVVADVIPLEEALGIAVRVAELVEYCVPAGGMLAILERLELTERRPQILAECEVAAVNFDKSFVITGRREALRSAGALAREAGVSCIELPVLYPFHSQWMGIVRTPSHWILDKFTPKPSSCPLISALRGSRVEFTAEHLWAVTRERIDFRDRVRELEETGPWLYVDLGPSGSLATAVKYNLPPTSRSAFASVITQFGQECRSLERMVSAQKQFRSR